MRSYTKRAHPLLLVILILAVGTVAALPGSGARAKGSSPGRLSKAAAAPAPPRTKSARLALAPFAALQAAPASDSVSLFDTDCTTPKSSGILGGSLCAQFTAPAAAGYTLRRLQLVNPANLVVYSVDITTGDGSVPLTLPSDATYQFTPFGETPVTLDNRGTWHVNLIDTSDASVRAYSSFVVRDPDPAKKVADLQISKVTLDSGQATAGGTFQSEVWIFNAGPDDAEDVRFTDQTPANTTFQSISQNSGPAFNCTTPAAGGTGPTVCTQAPPEQPEPPAPRVPASFPKDATASFVITYVVSGSVGSGTDIQGSASVTSDTHEAYDGSNSSSAGAEATNTNPSACTLSCPANITQDTDPGQAGAIVNYPAPTSGGSCGQVATDHPSGSFFPIGTTVVTASVAGGPSCSFSVTVEDKRAVAVTPNGASDMTVECHTGFSDPGATATDGTNSLPVTATVTVPDPNGAVDQNGNVVQVPAPGNVVDTNTPNTYTITYSATANNVTATATRVVRVIDRAPPVISIAGSQNFGQEVITVPVLDGNGDVIGTATEIIYVMTLECHAAFTAPAATAADGCEAAPAAVSVTGSVDPNTVGDYMLEYSASDSVGNDGSQKLKVLVRDTTGPAITLNPGTSTVECHTSYTDPGATAADDCEGPVPVSTSGSVDPNTVGTYVITYTASDSGGRTTTATRTIQVVDTIAPTVTLNGPAAVTILQYSSFSDPGATAADGCAGPLAVGVSGTVNTNAVGTYVLTYSATDPSGNTGTATRTVTVIYNFTGFFSPVDNLPVLNQVKAGQTIPLKFSLMGNQGLGILPVGSPASQQVNCATNAPINDLAETDTPGGSTLTYDAGSDKYQYNWKTEKSWMGQCRQLVMTLDDGTTHTANFKFK